MKIPFISIPVLTDLGEYDIEMWIWSMPAGASEEFPDHSVWIEHCGGRWIAGVEKDREWLNACMWDEDSGDANTLGEITGKHAEHVNPLLKTIRCRLQSSFTRWQHKSAQLQGPAELLVQYLLSTG